MVPLSISENILLVISGSGVVQGVLLAALLYFHPKSDPSVNKFLALYILCLSIVMSGPFMLRLFSWRSGFVTQPLPMIIGPLMYLYIRSYRETVILRKALPHIVPFLLFIFVSFAWHIYLARTFRDTNEPPYWAFQSPLAISISCIPYTCLVIYYVLARRELTTYQHTIRHLFSETSKIDLQWAKWLVNGYIAIVINAVLMYTLIINYPEHFSIFYLITIAVATPYIYITTYKGMTNLTIWQKETKESKEALEEKLQASAQIEKESYSREKSQRGGICDSRIGDIVGKINLAMEHDKLYQETELTLQHLADRLRLPSYLVSQAINEGMNKNFYDLVNGHRVEEAKRLLLDTRTRNYTILSVGFEAGFNSKTTFNTVFKKFTGLTPTVFRDQQMKGTEVF